MTNSISAVQAAFDSGSAGEKSTFQAAVSGDVTSVRVGDFGAGATVAAVLLTKMTVSKPGRINQITVNWTSTLGGTYYEIAIYDASLSSILCRSGVRDHPDAAGVLRIALPSTHLPAGDYWVALSSTGAAAVSVTAVAGEVIARRLPVAIPLPSSIPAGSTYASAGLSFALDYVQLPAPAGGVVTTGHHVRVYGQNTDNAQLWGANTLNGRMCYTPSAGATWVDAMVYPPITYGGIVDLTIVGGKLYVLTTELELFESSDLTTAATWANISTPIATGMRRSVAKGRPYGLVLWQDWLFVGEYTSPGEMDLDPNWINDQAGPRVFRYGPMSSGTRTWVKSAEFNSARHVHSIFSPGPSILFVNTGDLGNYVNGKKVAETPLGADVAIHAITAIVSGGPDTRIKWTGSGAPMTTHYPVDFLTVSRPDAPVGIYGSSDSAGIALQYVRLSGTFGAINNNAMAYRENDVATETCRSIAIDPATGNLYWWTSETTDPGIYVCPPPYTRSRRIYAGPETVIQVRSFVVGNTLFHLDQRITLARFPWQ